MKIAVVLTLVAAVALVGCGDDEPPAERGAGRTDAGASPGGLPSGEFSVCAFAYGPEAPQILIGPCTVPPEFNQQPFVPYVEEDGATGTSLPRVFEGQAYFNRQLITDPDQAAALRSRLRELAVECERNPDGCFSR